MMSKNFKEKLRDILIWLTHYSGWPLLKVSFYRWLKIPLMRVVAFHEIKDGEVANFQKVIAFLKNKFNVISPEDFLNGKLDREKINLLLTFDDAYQSWLKNAAPYLKKEGLKAIFFLENKGMALAKTLREDGFVVGGHTVNHSRLAEVSQNVLSFEIQKNKRQLEGTIGQSIVFFAYPFGDKQSFNQTVIDEVKKAGYQYAFTILPGFNKKGTNHYLSHRDSIDVNWSENFLKVWLFGAYDCWKRLSTS